MYFFENCFRNEIGRKFVNRFVCLFVGLTADFKVFKSFHVFKSFFAYEKFSLQFFLQSTSKYLDKTFLIKR